MTAQSRIAPGALEASLHFLRPMDGRPVAYQYDPPPGIPARTGTYDAHAVTIRDARPLGPFLSLDEEGFRLIRAPSAMEDFDDEQAIARRYYPEVERHIAEATGAELVIGLDHNVRNAARAARTEPG